MKSPLISTIALVVLTASSISPAFAKAPTQGQLLTQCKNLVNSEFDNVVAIKSTNIKIRRGNFSTKMRITTDTEKSSYLCSIERDQAPQLARIGGTAPAVAAKP